MPDHLHAILEFGHESGMSRVVGDWKAYHSRCNSLDWQDGYFDYRIRNPRDLEEKMHYMRMNPVAKGLCAQPEDWPWIVMCTD